jgi:hypothetical protein
MFPLRVWVPASLLTTPPVWIVSVSLALLGPMLTFPEVEAKVRLLMFQLPFLTGISRVLPTKMRLALPSFAGAPLGFQLLGFCPPPLH